MPFGDIIGDTRSIGVVKEVPRPIGDMKGDPGSNGVVKEYPTPIGAMPCSVIMLNGHVGCSSPSPSLTVNPNLASHLAERHHYPPIRARTSQLHQPCHQRRPARQHHASLASRRREHFIFSCRGHTLHRRLPSESRSRLVVLRGSVKYWKASRTLPSWRDAIRMCVSAVLVHQISSNYRQTDH